MSGLRELVVEKQLSGFNVTIPHKLNVIKYLDELQEDAEIIGAVNVVDVRKGDLIGYNTDYVAFRESIKPLLIEKENVLVLGNGGASKAVIFALKELGCKVSIVSRNSNINYS